jgi:hypothetical protein
VILIATRNDVMKETQRKHVPWEHSALTAGSISTEGSDDDRARKGGSCASKRSPQGEAWLQEPKLDGYRFQIVKVESGEPRLVAAFQRR